MANAIIRNLINGKVKTIKVPCTGEEAVAFADEFLEGEYEVLEFDTEVGTDSNDNTGAMEMQIMVKNSTTDLKAYFTLVAKSGKDEDEVFTALKGLTLNGVLVDTVYCLGMKPL